MTWYVEILADGLLVHSGLTVAHVICVIARTQDTIRFFGLRASVLASGKPSAHKTIVFGGANCEGVMGLELHQDFPWVDYVCSGEADHSFPLLLKRLESAQPLDGIPGVIYRRAGVSCIAGPPDHVKHMDALPDPDYRDYFAAVQASTLSSSIRPALLIETARGCWWSAKAHCTFCGLNGSTMAFRAKSAKRVYEELERQKDRYGVGRFLAVDNIMDYHYFRDLLPMLKQRNPGITLFYEVKSNLRRAQVELLRDAGVLSLQPGIESLSSHVLGLMRKGVSAIQNVQLLLCKEYGIEIAWNLLYGFPGEKPEDYEETARVIAAIVHLKAPGVVAPIRLDRFSPNYDDARQAGFTSIVPFSRREASLTVWVHRYFHGCLGWITAIRCGGENSKSRGISSRDDLSRKSGRWRKDAPWPLRILVVAPGRRLF